MAPLFLFFRKGLFMAKGPSKESLIRLITETAAPAAASFGLEVWGIELLNAGRPVARIFVDAPHADPNVPLPAGPGDASSGHAMAETVMPAGATIDHCVDISRLVGLALEVEEAFADAWVLEVSSPGLERPFFRPEQMTAYKGRKVEVMLWEPHPDFFGRKKFRGELLAVEGDRVTLRVAASSPAELAELSPSEAVQATVDMPLAWSDIRKARLIHIFPDTSKPKPGKTGKGGGKKA